MHSSLRIRQAVIQDLLQLVPVFDSYREYFKQEKNPETVHKFLFDKFEHRESVIFVAEIESRIIGFAQLYPLFSSLTLERVWLLNDFFIVEDYRHRGVGTQLLHAVKEYVTLTNAKGIELSVEHTNVIAWQFYEKMGFVCDDEFRWYFYKK